MSEISAIFDWTISASLKTVPIIFLIWLMQQFAKKYSNASGLHYLWLLTFLSLSMPWGWEFNSEFLLQKISGGLETSQFALQEQDFNRGFAHTAPQATTTQEALEIPLDQSIAPKQNKPRSIFHLLAVAWLIGIVVFVFFIAKQTMQFRKMLKNSIAAEDELNCLVELYLKKLAIKQSVELKYASTVDSPITYGIFKPVVILPSHYKQQVHKKQIEHVLLHELIHIKRMDIAASCFATVVTLLHWYNPFVWLALSSMRKNIELACDADVVKQLTPKETPHYGETLIKLSDKQHQKKYHTFAVGILEKHHQLKERILMLKKDRMNNPLSKLIFTLIAILITISAFAKPGLNDGANQATPLGNTGVISLATLAQRAENILKTPVLVSESDSESKIRMPKHMEKLNYGSLLSILHSNEYTAYKSNDLIKIIRLKNARSSAIPVVEANKTYHDNEYVTAFLKLEKSCAMSLLPILRPMVPRHSHMAASKYRSILITDSYGNIKRIKRVISEYENSLNKQEKNCSDIAIKPSKKLLQKQNQTEKQS